MKDARGENSKSAKGSRPALALFGLAANFSSCRDCIDAALTPSVPQMGDVRRRNASEERTKLAMIVENWAKPRISRNCAMHKIMLQCSITACIYKAELDAGALSSFPGSILAGRRTL